MQSELQRVLELQPAYVSNATPEMTERGILVRQAIPAWLRDHGADLSAQLDIDDLVVKGSDGVGRKARIPWTRFGSESRSPRATEGFYAVYLFDAPGSAVYLSLNQGTTDMIGGDLVSKDPDLIVESARWARAVLGPWLNLLPDDSSEIALQDAGLGFGYELGNIASIRYEVGAVPDEDTLLADARRFAEGLKIIYREHETRPVPGEQPELREAEQAALEAVGIPNKRSRAGFRTNAAEIKAIETHAVAMARSYYELDGFDIEEFGKPFDLRVTRGDEVLDVEVKGTTSRGSGVALTGGEVLHHAKAFPNNALVVVRDIVLHRDPSSPTALGGHLFELRAWEIDEDALRVISYAYSVPDTIYGHAGIASDALLSGDPS